jgi:hypothetical protein
MRVTAELYIGPDIHTGLPNISKITEVVKERHTRFVIKGPVLMYWGEEIEHSLVVQLTDEKQKIYKTMDALRYALNHDVIGIAEASDITFL